MEGLHTCTFYRIWVELTSELVHDRLDERFTMRLRSRSGRSNDMTHLQVAVTASLSQPRHWPSAYPSSNVYILNRSYSCTCFAPGCFNLPLTPGADQEVRRFLLNFVLLAVFTVFRSPVLKRLWLEKSNEKWVPNQLDRSVTTHRLKQRNPPLIKAC